MSMTMWKLCCSCGWIWALTRGTVHIKSQYYTDVFLQFFVKEHYSWANLVKVENTGAETLNLLADLLQPIVYLWAHYSASVPIFILCLHSLHRLKSLWGKNFPTVFAKGIWSHLGPGGITKIKIIRIIAFKIGKGKNISLFSEIE